MTGKTVQILRAPLDRVHAFQSASGAIVCRLTRVTLYHDGGRAAGFELDAACSPETYQAIRRAGDFELSEGNQGAVFGGSLDDGQPVVITLFLRHELLRARFSTPAAFEAEVNAVLEALSAAEHQLARADSWVFVSVVQDVPGHSFQIGFKHKSYEGLDEHLLL